jgi:hypothetical protein
MKEVYVLLDIDKDPICVADSMHEIIEYIKDMNPIFSIKDITVGTINGSRKAGVHVEWESPLTAPFRGSVKLTKKI